MIDVALLLAAVLLAAVGGAFFVRGVHELATAWRLPRTLVATMLAAAATSAPELSVSTLAALAGAPQIGLGDALGSNVVNVALVLGLALLAGPLPAHTLDLRRDYPLALAAPGLTLALAADGVLSRGDGLALLAVFAAWLALALRAGLRQRAAANVDDPVAASAATAVARVGAGLVCLLGAGRLFVLGAGALAADFGVPDYVVGATVVAIGTSLPELATTVAARLRGQDDVGLATVLGSNLFNGLAIVGVAATLHPIAIAPTQLALALAAGVLALLALLPRRGSIPRSRGALLLAVYVLFVAATVGS